MAMRLQQAQKTKESERTLCVMYSERVLSDCRKYAQYFADNGEPLCHVCNEINNRIILERKI